MSGDAGARPEIPEKGSSWSELRERLDALGKNDVDWRTARTAVYVFHAGDDVLAGREGRLRALPVRERARAAAPSRA